MCAPVYELGLGNMYVYTVLVQYLSNTEILYPKNITKPNAEISDYGYEIANIAIFSEWNI